MAISTISFTTLGYRNLDALGHVIEFDDVAGRPKSILPRNVNLYSVRGDGDSDFEAGETAHRLGDLRLFGELDRVAANVTADDPVNITAHGRISPVRLGALTEAINFRNDAFGVDNGSDDRFLFARYLNGGDSLTFQTRDPLSSVSFVADLMQNCGNATLLIDLDGDVVRTTNGSASGTARVSQERAHFKLALSGIREGDRITLDFDAEAILVNGSVASARIATAASIEAFFDAFEASPGKMITVGSRAGTPVALKNLQLNVDF